MQFVIQNHLQPKLRSVIFVERTNVVGLSVSIVYTGSPNDFTSFLRPTAEVAAAAAHVAMAPIHENNVGHRMLRYTAAVWLLAGWVLAGSAIRKRVDSSTGSDQKMSRF